MLTILHISDLHFGPPYYPEVGDAVQRLAAELAPDVIVASGDFTQRAKEEQFRAAAEFLALLPAAPLIVTPGNHDVPMYRVMERLFDPYRYYQQYILPELDTVTEVPGAVIVAINSTAPHRALTNGRIHRWQIDFAREAFTGLPDETLKILVAHHHFAPPPDWEGAEVMPKAKRALDAFTGMGVDMILGGHLHRAYIGNSLDVYSGPSRDHGIVIVQSGTTTSRRGRAREREKNSLNVLRVDGKLIRVTHHMYFEAAGGFVPSSRHIFYRGGHPPMPGDGEEQSVLSKHDEHEDLPLRR
jgi:3',5'-cyclic AMP phosphodiesterase CpdA